MKKKDLVSKWNTIGLLSDEEPISYVSEKHRWSPLNQNEDE